MLGSKLGARAVAVAAAALLAAACGSSSSSTGGTAPADVGKGQLTGAGSTFMQPMYQRAFYEYQLAHPDVQVNYQPIGSGAGISAFTAGTVDFGATDVPMKASEITKAGGPDTLVQIPTSLGVAAIAYNLPSVSKLQLDGPTLANIYLGHITKWDDPAIAALNPGVSLPSTTIIVYHRSDGSGTSYAFTDYLSKVSDEWKSKVGVGKSVSWPAGNGAPGNTGVAQGVSSPDHVGAIGYVELAYVVQAKMQSAYLKNAAGNFVQATQAGATAAAAQNTSVSATNFSITNEPGDTTYPIATFSWVVIRSKLTDPEKGKAMVLLFKWLVTDGQKYGTALQYAPLPSAVQTLALNALKSITVNGSSIF